MLPELERLIRLQQLDVDVATARQAIDAFPNEHDALNDRLAERRTALEQAEARQAEQKTDRTAIEKDLATVQGRLSRFKDQLMEVKTNKEFHAMQSEIATAEAEVQRFEDRLLELMLEADELQAAADAARAALTAEEAEVKRAQAALEAQRDRLQAEMDWKGSEREAVAAALPAATMALFESVVRQRKGIAVSGVRDGRCGACQVRLRPQLQNEVRRNDALRRCESCQRILYFPAATETAAS